jgi:hypothetical protein
MNALLLAFAGRRKERTMIDLCACKVMEISVAEWKFGQLCEFEQRVSSRILSARSQVLSPADHPLPAQRLPASSPVAPDVKPTIGPAAGSSERVDSTTT